MARAEGAAAGARSSRDPRIHVYLWGAPGMPAGRRRGAAEKGLLPFGIRGSCLEVVHVGVRTCAGGGQGEGRRWKGRRPRARFCLPRQMASAALLRRAVLRAWRRPWPLPAFPLCWGSRWSGALPPASTGRRFSGQ